jgi:hypothetical protein
MERLELRLKKRLFEGSVAEIGGATSTIHLLLKPAGTIPFASSRIAREYQRHWTQVHLDFVTSPFQALGFHSRYRRWYLKPGHGHRHQVGVGKRVDRQ